MYSAKVQRKGETTKSCRLFFVSTPNYVSIHFNTNDTNVIKRLAHFLHLIIYNFVHVLLHDE